MKVLLITDNYILENQNGAYYHRCIDQHIETYKSLGDIRLCLPIANTVSINRPVDLTNVGIRRINKENNFYQRFIDRSYNKRVIEEEVVAADIIVGFVPSSVCDLALKYAHRHDKIFVSVVIASAWDILWHHSFKGKLQAPISHYNTKRTIKHSDYVVYVTERYLQSKYPTNGHGIGVSDVVLEDYDKGAVEYKVNFFDKKEDLNHVSIMSIGAIDVRYKGHADVIKALSILTNEGYDIHYWLIGGGSDRHILKLARQLGVETNVHIMGALPHEDIFKTFDTIDIYIQPSHTEGLPRAVIEAMSRAVPVICTNVGGMPELISERCIYPAGDIQQLAERIRLLSSSKEMMKEEAMKNHEKSAAFQRHVLKQKRDDFLKSIKSHGL